MLTSDTPGTPRGTRGEPGPGLTAADVRDALGTTTLGMLTLLEQGKLRIDEDSVAEYIASRLPARAS